jgi:hypothetical protein
MRPKITTLERDTVHVGTEFCNAVGQAAPMSRTFARAAILGAALLTAAQAADAHGIAGNRYFDGTLTFDDPAVADEAILPLCQNLAFPAQGSNVDENRIIPLNRAGGNSAGFRAQFLFFLDDLIPSVFGTPLISNRPARSQIAW